MLPGIVLTDAGTIKDILDAYGEVADARTLAAWFHYPNCRLVAKVDGNSRAGNNLAPKDCLDRRDDVVMAAAKGRGTYVG